MFKILVDTCVWSDLAKDHKSGAPETVQRDVWAGARRSARRVQKRRGTENLVLWDDFEWGRLNGKLSALGSLGWVLGDDWDMLDT